MAADTQTAARDVTRRRAPGNRIFAFDASTGAIDDGFNPSLGGAANSLDTDGTYVYVGGSFGSVGGNTAYKRVVRLTGAGTVDPAFRVIPNSAVNEVVVRGSRVYVGGGFTSIKAGSTKVARAALAALDKDTGAVRADVNVPFTGLFNGGATAIKRFDVTPDGTRLVAVGNFTHVGGEPREQIAMLDTSGVAALAPWVTDRYGRSRNSCASVFDTFMRDVDFSPDGDFFVVNTTGAYAGGGFSGTLCDTTARWETHAEGAGQIPSWATYTGGDTSYGVAVTGTAVYVGGHMRWENNAFSGDNAGPGAVPREGIAALDPLNGLPLSWNPGRSRGVGAQAIYATGDGLWIGSDTTRFGRETHGRIAFVPLAGGKMVPAVPPAALPNDLFLAERTVASSNVLYRVNAGGPSLQASDGGPDWAGDSGFVTGGNAAAWPFTLPVDASVPASTPPGVFATERWHATNWDFRVAAGKSVTVRLYFANQCGCTSARGQRQFDVSVDGTLVLDNFDIVAAVGDKRGTMRAFTVTSDGNVDIDLTHVVENPLVNGIEIIDNSVPTPPPAR